MDHTCTQCGAALGVGRFCLNCGHRIGAPGLITTPSEAAADSATAPQPRDSAEDLLPFDDSYDPDLDAPLRGNAWMLWVIGATLLVGLAIVVLAVASAIAPDAPDTSVDDPPTAQQAKPSSGITATDPQDTGGDEPGEPGEKGPRGAGKPFNAALDAVIAVPSTSPATTDLDGTLVAYTADKMHDGLPATAWRMDGDGTGSTITITLAEPIVVKRVGLINGYAKQVSGVDWYPNNRRILSARWGFEDGSTLEQTFVEGELLQRAKVPAVLTSTITLTLTSVTPPGPGEFGRGYTAISEVAVIGRRVG